MEQRSADIDQATATAVHERVSLRWRHGDATVDFRDLALVDPTMERGGVYVIHRAGRAQRLGQATRVRDRLRAHQQDSRVVRTTDMPLSVMWALVPRAYRDGVEAYLGRVLLPEVAERFPTVTPIPVNLPESLRIAVWPRGVVQSMRSPVSPSVPDGVVVAPFLDAVPSNPRVTLVEVKDTVSLARALETLAWLHAKDAKNSGTHLAMECAMCAVVAEVEPLLARHRSPGGGGVSA